MEAQIDGTQRKVFGARVRPLRAAAGESGIYLRGGHTLPWKVSRSWSAPAGVYPEVFYLVDPSTREVLFEGPLRETSIWGLQSLTEVVDEVRDPIPLTPGRYEIVFSLGGIMGGRVEVEAVEAPAEAAA